MAKDYLEEMLGENEQIVLKARKHWSVLFGNIVLEIFLGKKYTKKFYERETEIERQERLQGKGHHL